jgi:hypothetical protein
VVALVAGVPRPERPSCDRCADATSGAASDSMSCVQDPEADARTRVYRIRPTVNLPRCSPDGHIAPDMAGMGSWRVQSVRIAFTLRMILACSYQLT